MFSLIASPRTSLAPGSPPPQVLTRLPNIIGLSVEGSLRPRVEYLVQALGLAPADIGKVVAREPQVRV